MSSEELVAVYGTLLRGFENHERAGMGEFTFRGECVIPGQLYDLGPYPGLKFDDEGEVGGELYAVPPDALTRLDRFEGATGPDPLYVRRARQLLDPSVEAWVYEYAGDVEETNRVESGDWRVYTGRGSDR